MSPRELRRAIARATGESLDTIGMRGFSLVNDMAPLIEDDFDDLIADWDRIEAEEAYHFAVPRPNIAKTHAVRTTRGKTLRNSMAVRRGSASHARR